MSILLESLDTQQTLVSAGIPEESAYQLDGEWPMTLFIIKMESGPDPLPRLFLGYYELFFPTRPLTVTEHSDRFHRNTFFYRNSIIAFNLPDSDWRIKWDGIAEGAVFLLAPEVIEKAAWQLFGDEASTLHWRHALGDHMPAIAYLGLDIASQITQGYPAGKKHVELLTQTMLAMCVRRYASSENRDTSLVGVLNRRVLQAVDYINHSLEEDISTNDICAESACSTAHLNRLFRTELGAPLWEYVQQQRILRAGEKLLASDESIADIASSLKFKSRSRFIARFKNVFGCTPSTYRQQSIPQQCSNPT